MCPAVICIVTWIRVGVHIQFYLIVQLRFRPVPLGVRYSTSHRRWHGARVCVAIACFPEEPMKKPNKCMLVLRPQHGTEDYLIIPTGSDGSLSNNCLSNSSALP